MNVCRPLSLLASLALAGEIAQLIDCSGYALLQPKSSAGLEARDLAVFSNRKQGGEEEKEEEDDEDEKEGYGEEEEE